MKIIHTADIHLGSKMDSRFDKNISNERKQELRNTFKRLIEYAKKNNVSVIMLCGDIFDSDNPYKKDKDFFFSIIKNSPDIDFLYLKGNHDISNNFIDEAPENLKLFSNKWIKYRYGNVVISGIEICSQNISSYSTTLLLEKNDINLVMLHGQISDSTNSGDISIKKLQNKNIDYLALGHVHKYAEGTIDERGVFAYCGCLEGRGFDEIGEHGFVLVDVNNNRIERQFIPFAERKINEIDVDISGCQDAYSVYKKVKDYVKFEKRNLYRINLIGKISFDADRFDSDVEKLLADSCYFINVKNKTERKIDISKYEKDLSIRGEFIRLIYADKQLSDDEKATILNYGLRALDGREFD